MEFMVEALVDTLKLLPLLVMVYFLVSFLEYRYGENMGSILTRFGLFNPVIGAVFGCIPQCGFSVAASALYVRRLITTGTLLAVFLATSDEAVPVLLSMPHKANMVVLLIAIKIVIATVAGISMDLILRSSSLAKRLQQLNEPQENHSDFHRGCCSHKPEDKHSKIETLLLHPLRHTVKIFVYLFILSAVLNFVIEKLGEEKIASLFLSGSVFQPVLATVIGLVPNCFASVLLAKLFAEGTISFGSLVAGLCSAGGLGLLVLVRENKNIKNTIFVIGLLVIVSILAGVVVQAI